MRKLLSIFFKIASYIVITHFVDSFSPPKPNLSGKVKRHHSPAATATDEDEVHYEIKKENHILCPPTPLQFLPLNETIAPVESLPHLTITRISLDPDMFLMRNFLSTPVEQIDVIRAAVKNGMEYSGTSSGDVVSQRYKSYTSWIYPDYDEDDNDRGNEDDADIDIDDEVDKNGRLTAQYMTDLAVHLFCPESLMGDGEETFSAEPVQVVRYEQGGRYDFHHDGFNRFLTVLCYLNGVAGTWFPHAIVDQTEHQQSKQLGKHGNLPDFTMDNVAEGKIMGRDGLLVVGSEYEGTVDKNVANIVKINPGDALVFYSYDWIETQNQYYNNTTNEPGPPPTSPLMNYRSLHSGLTAKKDEKWIATNWFRLADK